MINIEMVKMRLPCVKCSGEGEHFVPAARGLTTVNLVLHRLWKNTEREGTVTAGQGTNINIYLIN